MCTSGVLGRDSSNLLGFKTFDSDSDGVWHGYLSHQGGLRVAGFGMQAMAGVNSGVNEAGVAIVVSYLSTGAPGMPLEDLRGEANLQTLTTARTAHEAADYLTAFFTQHKSRGGNHLLLDSEGTVIALEHEGSMVSTAVCELPGSMLRCNDSLLLPPPAPGTSDDSDIAHEDRRLRRTAMGAMVEAMMADWSGAEVSGDIEQRLRAALASHIDDGHAVGTICAHGVRAEGGRAPHDLQDYTRTGIIIDPVQRRLSFSVGSPCGGRWEEISL